MSLSPATALHRLKGLYRDAHHCDPPSDDHVLRWARNPEAWATHKIRFGNWSFEAVEATVRNCRSLLKQAEHAPIQPGQDPYDPLLPDADLT
jgi:hypothetical protein